ncbi:hypothetical protein ACE1CI_05500 [Aerosakkonemataceae cyanobacterium BLCC-F50]|uniref:Uncharacterized protein n=1 Tax=Floridaenema flaviceps BLCC-F50 TaxID=3153642 RepID=A0ABV4XLF8_9CYAN
MQKIQKIGDRSMEEHSLSQQVWHEMTRTFAVLAHKLDRNAQTDNLGAN